jgi:hypothetical protein
MVFTDSQLPFYYQWQRMIAQQLIESLSLLTCNQFDSADDCLKHMQTGIESLKLMVNSPGVEAQKMDALGQHLFGVLIAAEELAKVTGEELEAVQVWLMSRAIAAYRNATPEQLIEATEQMMRVAAATQKIGASSEPA